LNDKQRETGAFTLPDERQAVLTHSNAEMLTRIVEAVFLNMMNLEVSTSGTPWAPSADQLTSAVYFSGIWNGALLFECDRRQACQFTGRFLSMDPPEAVTEDVRGVLCELANMIGGNMKGVMAPGLSLSMPSFTEGSDSGLGVCESEVKDKLAFQCADGPFWVTLLAVAPRNSMESNT
jgi:CheY-specific phosphatase CheX